MSLPLTTQPTFPLTYYLINFYVMSHATKLQITFFFPSVLLYTQLPLVLHRNNPNIKFVRITTPFPVHIPSILRKACYLLPQCCIISSIPSHYQYFNIIFVKILMSWLLADYSKKELLQKKKVVLIISFVDQF